MRRATTVFAIVTGVLSVGISGQRPPQAPPIPSGDHVIVGRVVDGASGAAVPTAIVALRLGSTEGFQQTTERVLTDSQGRFFFDNLGPGSFAVAATKPGWIEGATGRTRPGGPTRQVVIREGERPAEISISLWRYAVIAGQVVDDVSEPLVGTEVRVFRGTVSAGRRHWTFVTRAITDDRGMYRFFQLVPGPHVVVVPAAVTTEPASFRSGNPLPNSYYQTMSAIGAAPLPLGAGRMPIGRGSLVTSVINLPPLPSETDAWRTYPTTFFPSSTSIASAVVVEAVSGRERAGTDIVMRRVPTFSVSGTVTAPAGVSAGSLVVHLLPADSAASPLLDVATAVTDGAGAFSFYGVQAGQYVARMIRTPSPGEGWRFSTCGGTGAISYVCTSSEGPTSGPPPMPTEPLLHTEAPIAVTDEHVRGVSLALGPAGRVRGRLEFEGTAARPTVAESQWISVQLDPAAGQVYRAAGAPVETSMPGRVGENGEFASASTWPGRYVVRVANLPSAWSVRRVSVQGRDALDTPFTLAGDIDEVVITLTDQVTELSGTLQRAPDQQNESISVLLFPVNAATWVDYGRSTRRVRMVTAVGGSYSMASPPEGDYFLLALPDRQISEDWRDPAFLTRVSAIADRITVPDGRATTHPLRVRSMP